MKKRMKKAFSVGLVVCLVLSVLPAASPAVAVETDKTQVIPITESTTAEMSAAANETTAVTANSSNGDISILQEDTSLRKEYEKHFLMSDGSYQVALYNEPVHKMEDGAWVEIDNTLTLQSGRYATADGLADVSFAQSYGDQLVTMTQGEYSVSWGVQAVSDSLSMTASAQAQLVTTDLSGFSAEARKTMAVKSSSTIQYRNALRQNVDLEYIVLPSRVKENIILQSAQDISGYIVTVYAENLSARLLDNREIEFYNSNDEVIFTMASPYMYDAAGELSEDITVEMVSKGSGVYFIQMVPSASWLSDASRVYPVVIDPQVSVDTTRSNIIDNYALSEHSLQNPNLDRLYIGTKWGGTARAYIQYATMPTLPAGATITGATMTVQFTSGTSTAYNASAYMVTGGEWESGTLTWENKPAAGMLLESNISHNNLTGYTFSCLSAVQSWYNGDTTGQNANYGIMLRYYDETVADYNAVYSADYTDESKRPTLTITYDAPTSTVTIDEGDTYALAAPDVSGTITWTSGNTSVATVSTSGVVTGIKVGETVITAAVDGVVHQTYTVYVTIEDGVYYIKSASVGLYLGTDGSIAENTSANLFAEATSGIAQVRQLWKITYLGSGYYSIRPMHKLDMGLHVTSNSVDIVSIGKTDTLDGVLLANRWGIEQGSDGYYLNYVNTSSISMKPVDGAVSPGMNVTTAVNSGLYGFEWKLKKVDDPPSGILLYDTETDSIITLPSRHITVGQTKTLADFGLAVNVYSGGSWSERQMNWTRQSGTTCLAVSQTTGMTTGVSKGTSLITGTSAYGNVEIYVTVTGASSTDFTFINHYDSTFASDPELIGYIDDAVSFVNEQYQRQFGVTFSSLTVPYYREKNIVDSCTAGINSSCHNNLQCGSYCNSVHHKNVYRVSDHLYSTDIPQNHVVVFWTNREFWTYCADGTTVDSLAGVWNHRPVVGMMTIFDNSTYEYDEKQMCMSLVLAHEFTHTVGMDDFYNSEHELAESYECAMQGYRILRPELVHSFYQAVVEKKADLFCPSCEAILGELLKDRI